MGERGDGWMDMAGVHAWGLNWTKLLVTVYHGQKTDRGQSNAVLLSHITRSNCNILQWDTHSVATLHRQLG